MNCFKALKDGKIIAVNETGDFPCMVLDEVVEDTEYGVADYVHCDGEFVLTTSDPAIEQYKAQKRQERDALIGKYDWRLSRYERQKAIGVETTDSEDVYMALCRYVQDLRDLTTKDHWWEIELQPFEENA